MNAIVKQAPAATRSRQERLEAAVQEHLAL